MGEGKLSLLQWVIGILFVASAFGVIVLKNPIRASLSFLFSLLLLAVFYLQLSAEFVALVQILVYAGAILVIFVFVVVLFQDAYLQLNRFQQKSSPLLIALAALSSAFLFICLVLCSRTYSIPKQNLPERFGTAHEIGKALYTDFFFPFEAMTLLFLAAVISSLYLAKKEK